MAGASAARAGTPVRVGVYNYAPLLFTQDGRTRGLFEDVLQSVAEKEHWDLEMVPGTFAQCLERLRTGKIDLLACVAATDEREKEFDFSKEYLFLDWGVVYRRKGARISSIMDLSGKRVAAVEGSVYAKELATLGENFDIGFKLELSGEYAKAFSRVERSEADAVVCGYVHGTYLEDKFDLERTDISFAPVKLRFAMKKGNPGQFLQPLDEDVSRLKQEKGSAYYVSYDRWMGFTGKKAVPPWVAWIGGGLAAGLTFLGLFSLALRKLVRARTDELGKAMASLGESERRFRSTFEQAAVGIAHKALDGHWLLVNQKLCDILGYTREEMLARTYQDITHPDDLGKDLNSLALLKAGEIPMYSLEKRYVRKDGGLVWVDLTASLAPGFDGEPEYVITVIQDISERKQVERELDKARKYNRNIIDSMPSVVIGVDAKGLVTHYNQPAARLLASPGEAAVGDPMERAFPAYASQMEGIRRAIKEGTSVLLEKQPSMIGGEVRYQDVLIYPLMANGAEGAVLRIDDVTERVRLTEMMVQTEKMMSVGGLAAGMAHEINNPLGAILQSAQVIQMHVDPEVKKNREVALECGCPPEAIWEYLRRRKILDFLDGIRESGGRAARIVANMLEFSRRSESRREPVSVSEVLDNSLALASSDYDLKKKFDFRHIDIVRDYAPDLPPAFCSRTEIEQVMLNLLKNAAQAMALKTYQGERPTITLRIAKAGDKVVVTVEDNGPGMEESVRKRVFEPFFTTKEPGQGTGLGLSVSYFIVASNHGGTISVDSAPGAGARFTIELPAVLGGGRRAS